MIFGIGSDILEIARIEASLARQPRLATRILGADELTVYERRKAAHATRGLRFLATRFAAKEAFSKAAGLGMHTPMHWRAIEVLNAASGKPVIHAHGAMAQWLERHELIAHVSMSDEVSHVVAFVILERKASF